MDAEEMKSADRRQRLRRRAIKGECHVCRACGDDLFEPYVKCTHADAVRLCLTCFSKGREIEDHQNDHNYEIVRNDFEFWSSSWKAVDELKLLAAIDDAGLGNWAEVAKETGKSAVECECHYLQYYVDNPAFPLPKLRKRIDGCDVSRAFPFTVKDDPPRPVFDSQLHLDMAGYSAARGDFITERNNYAEMDLRDLEFGDTEDMEDDDVNFLAEYRRLDEELKFALLDKYICQLKERARRKKIISNYGLIHVPKSSFAWLRYDAVMSGVKNAGNAAAATNALLRSFLHLVTADDFNMFLESLQHQRELEQRIRWLQEFRESGVTTFDGAAIYQKLKARHDEERCAQASEPTVLVDVLNRLEPVLDGNSSHRQYKVPATPADGTGTAASMEGMLSQGARPVGSSRRLAPPLKITDLPGYDKLNSKERELCSQVRFVPDAYLEFKTMLLNEAHRSHGSLRLAQARHLIKIDVNKTRKLYDFLVQEGFVSNN